jgi:uncharacterized protein (DUF924 family)
VYPPDVPKASNCFDPVTVFGVAKDHHSSPEDVHRFWFDDALHDVRAAEARRDLWFRCAPSFDEEVRHRFAPTIAAAARGELSSWEQSPQSCIALVVVLDQLPRNAFRNTAAAFANDALALGVTQRALAAGYLARLSIAESIFLLMPFQHVEEVVLQREGVVWFDRLHAAAPAEWRAFTANSGAFMRKHLEIVERFGRFPHRNTVLGRTSTPAEREYLESKPETFGQGG